MFWVGILATWLWPTHWRAETDLRSLLVQLWNPLEAPWSLQYGLENGPKFPRFPQIQAQCHQEAFPETFDHCIPFLAWRQRMQGRSEYIKIIWNQARRAHSRIIGENSSMVRRTAVLMKAWPEQRKKHCQWWAWTVRTCMQYLQDPLGTFLPSAPTCAPVGFPGQNYPECPTCRISLALLALFLWKHLQRMKSPRAISWFVVEKEIPVDFANETSRWPVLSNFLGLRIFTPNVSGKIMKLGGKWK